MNFENLSMTYNPVTVCKCDVYKYSRDLQIMMVVYILISCIYWFYLKDKKDIDDMGFKVAVAISEWFLFVFPFAMLGHTFYRAI